MKEILRTGDPVQLSWVSALLAGENIEMVVLDTHMSFAEGSISAIPRRIMVANEDYEAALRLLVDVGEIEAVAEKADSLLGGQRDRG
jgi:ABC-type phosphate/phosphonate transport system ATPase subunit